MTVHLDKIPILPCSSMQQCGLASEVHPTQGFNLNKWQQKKAWGCTASQLLPHQPCQIKRNHHTATLRMRVCRRIFFLLQKALQSLTRDTPSISTGLRRPATFYPPQLSFRTTVKEQKPGRNWPNAPIKILLLLNTLHLRGWTDLNYIMPCWWISGFISALVTGSLCV